MSLNYKYSWLPITELIDQSIPAAPSPPGLLRGIHPPCQSQGWGIENFVLPVDWAFSNPGAIPELGVTGIDWCIMLTFANSNLELKPKLLSPGFPSYIYCYFTLGNSNFPLTQSSFCFPTDHFYIIFPWITWTMFWALKSRGKTVYWRPKHWVLNFP